jgi:hypothetical protein
LSAPSVGAVILRSLGRTSMLAGQDLLCTVSDERWRLPDVRLNWCNHDFRCARLERHFAERDFFSQFLQLCGSLDQSWEQQPCLGHWPAQCWQHPQSSSPATPHTGPADTMFCWLLLSPERHCQTTGTPWGPSHSATCRPSRSRELADATSRADVQARGSACKNTC